MDAITLKVSATKASGAREDLVKAEKQMALLHEQLALAQSQVEYMQEQLRESQAREADMKHKLVTERSKVEGLEAVLRLKEAKENRKQFLHARDREEKEHFDLQETCKQDIAKLIDQHKADAEALQDKDIELEGMVEANNNLQSHLMNMKAKLSEIAVNILSISD